MIVNGGIRCWATGPGTVSALLAEGVPHEHIDAPSERFDSESLWAQVAGQVKNGTGVLIVRGVDVDTPAASRDWLAQQIRSAGGHAEFLAVYERRAPQLSPEQQHTSQTAAQDGSVWLLSSSQAVHHLIAGVPGLDLRHARALCTHPRIAETARAAGFGVVQSTQPVMDEVLRGLESLHV